MRTRTKPNAWHMHSRTSRRSTRQISRRCARRRRGCNARNKIYKLPSMQSRPVWLSHDAQRGRFVRTAGIRFYRRGRRAWGYVSPQAESRYLPCVCYFPVTQRRTFRRRSADSQCVVHQVSAVWTGRCRAGEPQEQPLTITPADFAPQVAPAAREGPQEHGGKEEVCRPL